MPDVLYLRLRSFAPWRGIVCALSIVLNTLVAGSLTTFPLFGPAIERNLALSTSQISTVASVGILAQYASAVLWGLLADRRGPGSASFAGALLATTGFVLMSTTLAEVESSNLPPSPSTWLWMLLYYAMVGASTSAGYMAALSTSARTYGSHPGLAIAIPCSIFGLSPLFLSTIGETAFHHKNGITRKDTFNAVGYLWMLAILVGGTNLFAAVGLSLGEHTQYTAITTRSSDASALDEETTPLVKKPDGVAPTYPLTDFIRDPRAWLFGLVLFTISGAGDMAIACLGSIVSAILANDPTSYPTAEELVESGLVIRARHVQVFAGVNTASRLLIGWASDRLSERISRLAWLVFATIIYIGVCFFVAFGIESSTGLWALSIGTGFTYGTVYTVVPSLVSSTWPLADFGRNWGMLSYCIILPLFLTLYPLLTASLVGAAGSFLYTILFGRLFELASKDSGQCRGRHCFETSYVISAVGDVAAFACLLILWKTISRSRR